MKLLDRSRRHVALTPAGRVLLEHATDLLARTEEAIEATRLAARGLRGRVRIAYTRSVPDGVARAIIEEYRDGNPDVEVELRVGHTSRNVEELVTGQVDAAFVFPPVGSAELKTIDVGAEPLVVALSADDELASSGQLRPADLRHATVVSWPRTNGPGLYDAIHRLVWGSTAPDVVREEPDEAHMLRAVAAGFGLAVCVASAVEPVNLAGLVVRRFEPPEPAVPLALAHRRDNHDPLLLRLTKLARRFSAT